MKKECIMIRIDKEEKAKIKKQAHRREMTVSEYIRWLIEKDFQKGIEG